MHLNNFDINFIHPKEPEQVSLFSQMPTLIPFDSSLSLFIQALSKELIAKFRAYPELVSLGFWMRESHIKSLEKQFRSMSKDTLHVARGTVLHFAPSNVDTIFIYSWFLSMLMGNRNIIRVSSKQSEQNQLLMQTLSKLLNDQKFKAISERTLLVQYEHNDAITTYLSSQCDTRVIWGGDATIQKIRSIPLPPTATELSFADKFSYAVTEADAFLKLKESKNMIQNFYNDAFWFSQMACSSIRMIVWVGTAQATQKARERFYDELIAFEASKPLDISASHIMDKQVSLYSLASRSDCHIESFNDNRITSITLSSLEDLNESLHCGNGLLYEYHAKNLDELFLHVNKKHQTLVTFGYEKSKLVDMVIKYQPHGIDRIVPFGKALEFSNVWDGYDLMRSFTRILEIY